MESIPYPIIWLGSYATTIAAVMVLFEYLERVLRPDARQWIADWLKGVRPTSATERWQRSLSQLIDRVFGQDPDSWRFAICTLIASAVSVVLTLLVWAVARTEQLSSAWSYLSSAEFGYITATVLIFVLNWLPDYLSLIESRWVIIRMQASSSIGMFGWLVVDLLATIAILFVCSAFVSFGSFITAGILDWIIGSPEPFHRAWLANLVVKGQGIRDPFFWQIWFNGPNLDFAGSKFAPAGSLFYSTFFTSIWVWLFLIGGLLVRGARGLLWVLSRGTMVIDVDAAPVRSIGFGFAVLVTVGYVIAAIFS